MAKKVIILGGGVAGMSAAHELIERGFEVEVHERMAHYVGGKARSIEVPGSAIEGYKLLPGEHGFRFFPGFYRHVTDTMSRIPLADKPGKTVYDNLVVSRQSIQAQIGEVPIIVPSRFPSTEKELRQIIASISETHKQFTKEEDELIFNTLWRVLTTCKERKNDEYERISWWNFTEAANHSYAYQQLFVIGLSRTLVAARAEEISAKTEGDILLQLMSLIARPGGRADQVLNGPTNEAWLYPWRDYLLSKGVVYQHGSVATKIHYDGQKKQIAGVDVQNAAGDISTVSGDYYIFAVPVEQMAPLVKGETHLLKDEPVLNQLEQLAQSTDWMSGIQFFLSEKVPMLDTTEGHVIYFETPWALTSISQLQFWEGFDISQYGNGQVKSILSVDISNWNNPGLLEWERNGVKTKLKANDCTREEIRQEVWYQLQQCLMVDGKPLLKNQDEILIDWYLDRDISFEPDKDPHKAKVLANREPLLINKVNTWGMRPNAVTAISNLFLASDYVRTFTDLATMEGANEAARRAVNGIIAASNSKAPYCGVWDLHYSNSTAVLRWVDKMRYERGEPWKNEIPFMYAVVHRVSLFLQWLFGVKA
ncbi:MAG: phytoene dehydrogenase [Bacteroidetes bacterium]|nr:MAG: phytoene dehydrogenase [Bacteroidota bacterium]